MVRTTIQHLTPLPKYQHEKPFKVMLDVSSLGYPQSNHELTDAVLDVADAQPTRGQWSMEANGFQFLSSPSRLKDSDFDAEDTVRQQYYEEIVSAVQMLYPPGSEVIVLGHKRRKSRDTPLPTSAHLIPVPYAHVDHTPAGSFPRCRELFIDRPDLEGRPFQLITLWRVTKGPNVDWPLAVCDFQTINVDRDLDEGDVVHRHHVGEHGLLYHHPDHRWYYLDGQSVEDLIIFRHCDSRGYLSPFSPHASFNRSQGMVGVTGRESIEVMVACFLEDQGSAE
ncbi:hypothetical protein F5X68DRAFT_12410 [Plectosphaerella plurivora]|uniref:Methyltransferase n=1 Tax=Plectosphaerella plurivora TaxID=936078 RepID=A0A9P9AA33_9PEZI|nr:hypothetical protein F5X68DRAFT_12410 [Plectosphaerella plurivora]